MCSMGPSALCAVHVSFHACRQNAGCTQGGHCLFGLQYACLEETAELREMYSAMHHFLPSWSAPRSNRVSEL